MYVPPTPRRKQAAVIRHFAAHPVTDEAAVEQVSVSPSLTVYQQLELAAAAYRTEAVSHAYCT